MRCNKDAVRHSLEVEAEEDGQAEAGRARVRNTPKSELLLRGDRSALKMLIGFSDYSTVLRRPTVRQV